jgi:hypothetical protein
MARIASGPSADFPHTVAAGEAMARFGSDDHYATVIDELVEGLAGRAGR